MTYPSQVLPNVTNILVSPHPIQLCPALGEGSTVQIYNPDSTNIIYAGYVNSLSIYNANPIQPLTYAVMDGSRQLWGFCPTANVSVVVTPGGGYTSPSPAQAAAQIAAQIALTGVPLLHNKLNVITQSNGNLLAGSTDTVSGNFTQVGFILWLTTDITGPASGAAQLSVKMQWVDTTSGNFFDERNICVWPGTGSADMIVVGRGPTRGNQLKLVIRNNGTTTALTYNIIVLQIGVQFERDFFTTRVLTTTGSAYNLPSKDLNSGILAANSVSIATGVTAPKDQLPLYRGKARLTINTASGAADCQCLISAADSPIAVLASGLVVSATTDSTGQLNMDVWLPGVQCFLTLTNHNASTRVCQYTLVAADY